jgi:hypothetical protein
MTRKRTTATFPPHDSPSAAQPPYDFLEIADLTCTLSALMANKLAGVASLLDEHDREWGADLGSDVAVFAGMVATALRAAELLHRVADDYERWMEVGAI